MMGTTVRKRQKGIYQIRGVQKYHRAPQPNSKWAPYPTGTSVKYTVLWHTSQRAQYLFLQDSESTVWFSFAPGPIRLSSLPPIIVTILQTILALLISFFKSSQQNNPIVVVFDFHTTPRTYHPHAWPSLYYHRKNKALALISCRMFVEWYTHK